MNTSKDIGQTSKSSSLAMISKPTKKNCVSESIAPTSMFMKNKGLTDSDVIHQTSRYLNSHAYKLTDIDNKNGATTSVTQNVRLLREIAPVIPNPYEGKRADWDETGFLIDTQLGSVVKAAASTSTWKRKN